MERVNYQDFTFNDVMPIGEFNHRLVLDISYKVGERDIHEQMIIRKDNGQYHFRYEGSRIKRLWENGEIREFDYGQYSRRIILLAKSWCENLGYPELTKEV